jgi:hypothetical protein
MKMDSQTALKQLDDLREKHANFGASDTEGRYAVMDIEDAVAAGQRFPFRNQPNPFQLYQSVPGWEQASGELVAAAQAYWTALTEEKLGIAISLPGETA